MRFSNGPAVAAAFLYLCVSTDIGLASSITITSGAGYTDNRVTGVFNHPN